MNTETKFIIGFGVVTIVLVIAGVLFFSKTENSNPTQSQNVDQNLLISDATHTKGEASASAKIVEFADFQCPACAQAYPIVENFLEENKNQVYFVFRHYPLPTHKNAKIAAQAAEAASLQGKFWEMYDLLFQNQKEWEKANNSKEIFETYAKNLNLNLDQFKEDLGKVNGPIEQDYALGNRVGVNSTPTFFINGEKYSGVIQKEQLQQIINGIVQNQGQKQ